MFGGEISQANAQGTLNFAANSPMWVGAPNRFVSTKAEWTTTNAQYTARKIQIEVFRVTIINGVRTLSRVGLGSDGPPIQANGNWTYGTGIAGPGTYCVQIQLTWRHNVTLVEVTETKQSPDRTL
jgi:hypothetical protein